MEEALIYIIDDDKANNYLTRLMLEDAGMCNFMQFRMGKDALDELKKNCAGGNPEAIPRLILLDLNMPGMDGWGFLHEYRKLPAQCTAQTSVFLLTSSDYPGDLEKIKQYPEISELLEKPLTEDVAKWLKEKYFSPPFE